MVVQSVEVTRGRFSWDTIGVGASTLCLVHCVLTPIALAFAPVLSEFLPGDTFVHRIVIFLVVAIGLFAFVPGYRKHRKWIVFLPMVVGVWAIGLGAFGVSFMGPLAEKCITILGSTFVISAHGLNRTFCKYCDACASKGDAERCGD